MNVWDYVDAEMRVFGLHGFEGDVCGCGDERCKAIGKHPRVSNWQYTPQWRDEQLEVMESTGQFDTGFGVLCNGLLVIDIDPRNGGHLSYDKLVKDTGIDFKKESGFVVATGGGGHHIYFTNPSVETLKKSLSSYEGIDFKTNGFVVGAGSIHRSGNYYEKESGHPCDLTAAPSGLLELLCKPAFSSTSFCESDDSGDIAEMLKFIDPNIEHDEWVLIGMAIHHATDGSGFELWDSWSSSGDSYDHEIMDFKWHSFGKGSGEPVTIATIKYKAEEGGYVEKIDIAGLFNKKAEVIEEVEEEIDPTEDPVNIAAIDIRKPSGFLGEIKSFIDSQCRYPRENISIGAAINALGNIGGMRWRDDVYGVTSNTFVFCVAGSGTGKEAVQTAQRDLQAAVGYAPATHGKIKSEQEMTKNLIDHQMSSYIIDELGIMLKKLENSNKSGGASYLQGVIGDLMSFYGKTTGRLPMSGDVYKNSVMELQKRVSEANKILEEKKPESNLVRAEAIRDTCMGLIEELKTGGLKNPFMTLIGFTTGVTFNDLVNYESATNGFIGRAILFEEKNDNPRSKRRFKKAEMSEHLKMKLNQVAFGGHSEDEEAGRIQFKGEHEYVTTSDEVIAHLERIEEYLFQMAENQVETNGLCAIVRRAFEQVLKISMVAAIGDGGRRTIEHVNWAYAVVRQDLDAKIGLTTANIHAELKGNENKAASIISKVKHCMSNKLAMSVASIANKNRKIEKKLIEDAIEYLLSNDEIIEEKSAAQRGKRSAKYLLK